MFLAPPLKGGEAGKMKMIAMVVEGQQFRISGAMPGQWYPVGGTGLEVMWGYSGDEFVVNRATIALRVRATDGAEQEAEGTEL